MRLLPFAHNKEGETKVVTMVISFLMVLGISVLIFYNIMASIDTTTIDANFGGTNMTPALNGTTEVLDQAATFYQVAPILAIVIIAVVIIAYVKKV